jgi:hypothetical protein
MITIVVVENAKKSGERQIGVPTSIGIGKMGKQSLTDIGGYLEAIIDTIWSTD